MSNYLFGVLYPQASSFPKLKGKKQQQDAAITYTQRMLSKTPVESISGSFKRFLETTKSRKFLKKPLWQINQAGNAKKPEKGILRGCSPERVWEDVLFWNHYLKCYLLSALCRVHCFFYSWRKFSGIFVANFIPMDIMTSDQDLPHFRRHLWYLHTLDLEKK